MACDTKNNTIKALLKKGVIDESRLILDLDEFDRLNDIYSETARDKYGVVGGLLFDIETTTTPRSERPRRPSQIIHRAVANVPMFEKLDRAVDTYQEKAPKLAPNDDGVIPSVDPKTKAYKSLTLGLSPISITERTNEERLRIQQLIIPRMKDILDILGVKTETVEKIFADQQQINRLQAILNATEDAEMRRDLFKQLKDLQSEGFMEDTAAFADTMNRIIQFADGSLSDDNFTEEAIHFIVDIVEQKYPALYNSMYEKITQFPIYSEVRTNYANDPLYLTDEGRPNFPKLKKEAIGQLLVRHLLYPEDEHEEGEKYNFIKYMWDKVSDFVRRLFNMVPPDTRESFREVAERILFDPAFITKEDSESLSGEAFEARKRKPKGAAKVLSRLAYEMRSRIEELKDVLPDWVKRATKPHFKNNEEQWKFAEQYRKDLTIQSVEVGKDDNGEPLMDNRYFYKGVRLPERTSTVIMEALGKAKGYTNLSKVDERALLREQKKDSGTGIHKDIQAIINTYVDPETGLLRDAPLEDIEAPYSPLEVWDILDKHIFERLQSYPKGTRFSSELPVINWLEGYAGTIDFMAILPDGSVDILDWKTNEVFQRSEWLGQTTAKTDVSPFDQRYWKEQLKLYKRAMFNMGFTNFRYTRAIPIATKFRKVIIDKALPATDLSNIRYVLQEIEVGSHDVKNISRKKNYLVPVAIETETTGKKQLDDLLVKLWGLRNRLQNAPHTGEEGIRYSEIERINNAIRELQIRQTANSITSVFTANFLRYQKLATKEAPFMDKLKRGEAFTDTETEQEVEAYIKELSEAYDFLKAFTDFASIIRDLYPAGALTDTEEDALNGVQDIETNAARIRLGIEDRLKLVANAVGGQFDINDVNALDISAGAYKYVLSNLYNREERSIQLFGRVKNSMDFANNAKVHRVIDELKKHLSGLEGWMTATGKTRKDAYAMVQDPETGRLINKISPKFWDTLESQREVFTEIKQAIVDKYKDVKFRDKKLLDKMNKEYEVQVIGWLKDNFHMDKFEESFEKRREGYIKYLNDTPFHDDPNIDLQKKEQLLAQWDKNNDILSYPEALRPGNNSIRVIEEKWYSPEFQELAKDENKAVLDLYNFFQGLNIRAINNGMVDDIYRPTTFTPQIERSDLKHRLKQSMLNKIKTFKYIWLYVTSKLRNTEALVDSMAQSDLLSQSEDIDPVTDRRILYIPVYYKRIAEDKEVETDLIHSFTKWAEHIVTYETTKEFEQRLNIARIVEDLKTETIDVDKKGVPLRDSQDPTRLKTSKKATATESDLTMFIERYVYSQTSVEDVSPVIRKVIDFLLRYTMFKYLSLNVPAFISNVVGGVTRRQAISMGYLTPNDLHIAQLINTGITDPVMGPLTGISELSEKAVYLRSLFKTNLDDLRDLNEYTREFGQGWKHKDTKSTVTDWALYGFKWGDSFVQNPLSTGLFMNAAFVDGKLINIPTYVRSLYPTRADADIEEQIRIKNEIEDKINELQKQSILHLVQGENGEFSLPELDLSTPEGKSNALRLSNLAQALAEDALGNTSQTNLSVARMVYWLSIPLQFKKWMPWQFKTFYGKFQYNYRKQAAEVGRVAALWHMLRNGAAIRATSLLAYNLIPLLPTATRIVGLTGDSSLNQAMIQAGKRIYMDRKEYLRARNQDAPFTEQQIIDLYKNTIDGEMKELQVIINIMLLLSFLGMSVGEGPDKDKWYLTLMARTAFMVRNELTTAYDPSSVSYLASHVVPMIGSIDDFVKIIKATAGKVLGTTLAPITKGKVRKKLKKLEKDSHPLYEIINATPIARQLNEVAMSKSKRWSKFLGKKPRRATW